MTQADTDVGVAYFKDGGVRGRVSALNPRQACSKRGPRDGWNGMTLKIFRAIIDFGFLSVRELARMFNLTKRAIRYHLHKLLRWGYVVRIPRNVAKTYPYIVYSPDFDRLIRGVCSRFHEAGSWGVRAVCSVVLKALRKFRFLRVRDIARALNKSPRSVRRYIRNGGFIRTGGLRCPYSYIVPSLAEVEHRHLYTRRHRYRFSPLPGGKVQPWECQCSS